MRKQKHFYSHIVDTSSLSLELGDMTLSQKERVHLISLIETNLHHEIIDLILTELSDDDKKSFLEHLTHDSHDEIWQLLNHKADNIEEKIQKVVAEVKKELHNDITKTKLSSQTS